MSEKTSLAKIKGGESIEPINEAEDQHPAPSDRIKPKQCHQLALEPAWHTSNPWINRLQNGPACNFIQIWFVGVVVAVMMFTMLTMLAERL